MSLPLNMAKKLPRKTKNIVKKFQLTKNNYKCLQETEDVELDYELRNLK